MQQRISFCLNDEYLKEDYIVSTLNEDIYNRICNCREIWGVPPYSTILLLIGPEASGKTHLANIWHQVFGSVVIKSFDEIYSLESDGYIIDDISDIAEDELLHIINYLHEEKKYLLMTSRDIPIIKLQDLASRLKAILTKHIGSIDEHMMQILLTKHFAQCSLNVSAEVIDFLAMRLTRNFADIKNFIVKLDDFALEAKRKITIPLVKTLLDRELSLQSKLE